MSDSVKLRIPGESFWGTLVSHNTARVDNVLLSDEYRYGDVVRFNPSSGCVTGLISRTYPYTFAVTYPKDLVSQGGDGKTVPDPALVAFRESVEALDSCTEGAFIGCLMVSSKHADLPNRVPAPPFPVEWSKGEE